MSQATEKSRRTKAHIIQSAVEMITEHGLEKISVNKVIRHAGISKGGFYYYFSDIDHLIKEVFLFVSAAVLKDFSRRTDCKRRST